MKAGSKVRSPRKTAEPLFPKSSSLFPLSSRPLGHGQSWASAQMAGVVLGYVHLGLICQEAPDAQPLALCHLP